MIRTKQDIETHYEYGQRRPAVNVKIYRWLNDADWLDAETPDGFDRAWLDANLTDEQQQMWWQIACEDGFEQARDDAEEIFGSRVKVWSEGRSGGWLVVDGLPDVDEWDAIMLGKWRRFAGWARVIADAVPASMLTLIALNVYEPARDEHCATEAAQDVPDWLTATQAARRLAGL